MPAAVDVTVLICTYNRAEHLAETIDSLAQTAAGDLRWNLVVVDNNSSDQTQSVVTSRIDAYPVPLLYLFEPRQGKSYALNLGMAATTATVIAFTDDDVRVGAGWLRAAAGPLLDGSPYEYTGGPVLPIWAESRPSWLDERKSDLWGTLAILDYGPDPFCFEERKRVPLGANMAIRRSLADRIGGFDPELGRKGTSLLGQEQAEFFARSRAAGARGLYVPEMTLGHHVPASRLTRSYFRRWWFWKGVSRRLMEQRHAVSELGLDLSVVPRLAGVPRFMVGSAARDAAGWMGALIAANAIERTRREMMLCFFAGYVRGSAATPIVRR